MTNRHMKRHLVLLFIKERQIKITMRCHPKQVRTTSIKMSINNKCCGGCGEKGNLLCCWKECK